MSMAARLHERLTFVRGAQEPGAGITVRGHVYYTTTGVDTGTGELYATEQARAMVPRLPYHDMSPSNTAVLWRGERFNLAGPPMLRTVKGRAHHYTIPLQRTTTA